MSSFLGGLTLFNPWNLGFNLGIEKGGQWMDGRNEGNLLWLAYRTLVPIRLTNDIIGLSGG